MDIKEFHSLWIKGIVEDLLISPYQSYILYDNVFANVFMGKKNSVIYQLRV